MKNIKRFLAPLLRFLAPSYGCCERCGVPWKFTKGHSTDYREATSQELGRACFPLCEDCWSELTPEARLPYYRQLWRHWQEQGAGKTPDDWRAIESAVRSGK